MEFKLGSNEGFSEGHNNRADGVYSHVEGEFGLAMEKGNHVEGIGTYFTTAVGKFSSSSSNIVFTINSGNWSTNPSIGMYLIVYDDNLEGWEWAKISAVTNNTVTISGVGCSVNQNYTVYISDHFAIGEASHAEGYSTKVFNNYSHAEGSYTTVRSENSHAEGDSTEASGSASHAEGNGTTASGHYSHAEGENTKATGMASHAEGKGTTASGNMSHAEGNHTVSYGVGSHSEGYFEATAIGSGTLNSDTITITAGSVPPANSLIFWYYNDIPCFDIVESIASTNVLMLSKEWPMYGTFDIFVAYQGAIGDYSHAEGYNTKALHLASHAEGLDTESNGVASHAEGYGTQAIGNNSHSGGLGTYANSKSQTTIGEYNTKDTVGNATSRGNYAFIVGNGTSDSARSNAFAVKWNGDVYAGTNGNKKLATEEYVGTTSISQAQHYMPTLTDSTIPLITEGTDTTTVPGESIEYVNYARELNIDAKKHLISAEYERYDFPAEPKISHNFIVSWLVMNLSRERLVSDGTVYNGKIAIPLFCPRSALKGYMTQRYWLWGKNNFRQCDMFIQNYILDSETLIRTVNDDLFWRSFGISGFIGGPLAYLYLQARFGIGGHSANVDYSACSQYRTLTIDMRNHWTVFDSDYYWERNPVSRNVQIHHSALYHCGGALNYNNDVTIQSTDICYNTLQLSFTNERVREDFLGGRRYNGFYLGDEEFYDFGFMIFQTGIAPDTNDYKGGWDGTDFVNYTNQFWKKIYDSLKEISHDSTVLSEISNSPYFAER